MAFRSVVFSNRSLGQLAAHTSAIAHALSERGEPKDNRYVTHSTVQEVELIGKTTILVSKWLLSTD